MCVLFFGGTGIEECDKLNVFFFFFSYKDMMFHEEFYEEVSDVIETLGSDDSSLKET